MRQLVAGSTQTARILHSILGQIDLLLRMLNPKSYGKCFWRQLQRLLRQHLKGIPGTVTDGQHHSLRLNPLCHAFLR